MMKIRNLTAKLFFISEKEYQMRLSQYYAAQATIVALFVISFLTSILAYIRFSDNNNPVPILVLSIILWFATAYAFYIRDRVLRHVRISR